MITRRAFTIAIAVVLTGLVGAVAYANLTTGTKAPTFTLPTLSEKTFTLSQCFADKPQVVVLDIWATWCPPCRAEIPQLINLAKTFKGKGVTFVGVALDEEKSTVEGFAEKQKINYTIAHDPGADTVGKLYKVEGIPATYIIDTKGVIRYVHSGFPRDPDDAKAEAAQIAKEIRSLLAKKN